jgi:hypothetical protein
VLRWRYRFAGLVGSLLLTVAVSGSMAGAAFADRVVNGCKIVARPTAQHHTRCVSAKLRGAHLRSADLEHASLVRANLSRADLSGADLRGANLTGAKLVHTDLRHAILFGANLRRARVGGAILAGVELCRTRLPAGQLTNSGCPPGVVGDEPPPGAIVCQGVGTFICDVNITIHSSRGLQAGSAKVVCPTYVAAAPIYLAVDQPPLPPPRNVLNSPAVGVTSPNWLRTIVQPPEDSWVVKWDHLFSRLDKTIWITFSAYGTGRDLPRDRDTSVEGAVECTESQDIAYIVPSILP